MKILMRILSWLGKALLPVRLRPTALQQRLTQTMESTVVGLEKGAKKAGKSVEKVESGETPPSKLGTFFRWLVHFLVIAAILYGLYCLNSYLMLPKILHSVLPVLHPYWLPLLFLLIYFMAWFAWALWQLTGPEKVGRDYPDVNDAWADATRAVADAGIELRHLPLFLVLGRPEDSEDTLFEASGRPLRVRAPRATIAPLHIFADKEGIFLTCAGASVLGTLLSLLGEEKTAARARADAAAGELGDELRADGDAPPLTEIQSILDAAQQEGRGPDQLSEEEKRVISILVAEEQADQPPADDKRKAFLKDSKAVELQRARLRHLCRLVARDRRPYCPINGILVVLPFRATDTDQDAAQFSAACQSDLTVVREVLQVQCPLLAMTCDLQKTSGFREFLARLPAGQRDRRLGQRFPLSPDMGDHEIPEMVQQGVGWLCQTLVPSLVYNLFRLEPGGNGQAAATVEGNMRLYRFLHELRERRQRFGRLLTRGLLVDVADAFRFGGFYLAGTGDSERDEQAFVSGVVDKLVQNQNYVAWTKEIVAAEAGYQRWTRTIYLMLLLLVAAVAVLIFLATRG